MKYIVTESIYILTIVIIIEDSKSPLFYFINLLDIYIFFHSNVLCTSNDNNVEFRNKE